MAKKLARRISDVFNYADHMPTYVKVDEILGVPLTLISFITRFGDKGQYAVLTCVRSDTGEQVEISTGAAMVMKTLQVVSPTDLPIDFQFEQVGRAYVMADTDQPSE